MRPPRPKIHMIDVSDPIFSFHNLIVRCQVTLRNAEVKMMAASDTAENCLPPIGICKKCLGEYQPTGEALKTTYYTYWLVEGEEEKAFKSQELEAVA